MVTFSSRHLLGAWVPSTRMLLPDRFSWLGIRCHSVHRDGFQQEHGTASKIPEPHPAYLTGMSRLLLSRKRLTADDFHEES